MLKSKKKSVQSALTQHTRQCNLFSSSWAYEKVAAKKKKNTYIYIYICRKAHTSTHTHYRPRCFRSTRSQQAGSGQYHEVVDNVT